MPKFLVHCYITQSIVIEADTKDQAIVQAPEAHDLDGWDESEEEYEAEEEEE